MSVSNLQATNWLIASNMTTKSTGSLHRVLPLLIAGAITPWLGACAVNERHTGFQGLVSAATPEAAQAGRAILERGGNAIDAAVAVSFALAVTEPFGSGVGGQSVFLVQAPGGEPFVLDGSSRAPDMLPDRLEARVLTGRRASTVPTTVKVLDLAWRKFGSGRIPWNDLIEPAITLAESGYRIGPYHRRVLAAYGHTMDRNTAHNFLQPDMSVPDIGTIWTQPKLAETLKRIARDGATVFYTGRLARDIASDMAANGGWITYSDLASLPEPRIVDALRGTYRGWEVYTLPPPFGGWVVLQALGILERVPTQQLQEDDPRRIVWLAEALRLAHLSRETSPVLDIDQPLPYLQRQLSGDRLDELQRNIANQDRGETTHFSIVDRDGMVVGVSSSINAFFGAKVAHPTLGFLYNDYMNEFVLNSVDHPYALKERALPYSSMSATLLARNGCPQLVVGSPGSKRIVSTVTQVINLWVDCGSPLQQAVAAPRLHVITNGELLHERNIPVAQIKSELESRGLRVRMPVSPLAASDDRSPYFGGVHAIAFETGAWRGAADPRRDGAVARCPSR